MAQELSTAALLYSQQTNIRQQFILEIDGLDTKFGAVEVLKVARLDDGLYLDDGHLLDSNVTDPDQKDWISLGSLTKTITQQIQPDKVSTNSVSAIQVPIIDKNGQVTAMLAPGVNIPDIIGARCRFYLNFAQGAHPEDSILVFSGIVDDYDSKASEVLLNIAHPEQLKRRKLFTQVQTKLNGSLTSGATTIPLDTTTGLILPASSIKSFIRIDDEIIRYTGISGSSITGCTRGSLGTVAATHDDDADVVSLYSIEDDAITLALRLQISGSGVFASESLSSVNYVLGVTESVQNALMFSDHDIEKTMGLVIGDIVNVAGSISPSNDFTGRTIVSFGKNDAGSYIIVDGANLVNENEATGTASFKSQYDVYPTGAKMTPREIDVPQFVSIQNLFGAQFHSYDILIKDTITLNEFLAQQIYFPSGLFDVPRKGKVSIAFTNPPIADASTPTLNLDNVIKPEQIGIRRSINKLFYNSVVFKYDEDALEDKFRSGEIIISETSLNRIDVGNRPLTIAASGVKTAGAPIPLITAQARRFLDEYQFGAANLTVMTNYKIGFALEVTDLVVLSNDLGIADPSNGTRSLDVALWKVTNKSFNLMSGEFKFTLVNTAYDTEGRYGTIAPSSLVGASATTTRLPLKQSFGNLGREGDKWSQYIGLEVLVHDETYTLQSTSTIVGFDPISVNTMILSPALSFVPAENYIVDTPNYPDSVDESEEKLRKLLHAYISPMVNVISGTSTTVFDVDDVTNLYVGSFIRVFDPTHTLDSFNSSEDIKITDITGTTITVDTSLGFIPALYDEVDLIGFPDGGEAYRLI